MTDVFRSEILAVVMQQIMDEPILPVLFLRTVSVCCLGERLSDGFMHPIGDTSSENLQVFNWLCVDDAALSAYNQEDMDQSTPLGGLYSLCESHRSCKFQRPTSAAKGSTPRVGG